MRIAAVVSRKGSDFDTVADDRPLSVAVEIMHRKAIGSVGVTDKDGRLIGLISQPELLAAIALFGSAALSRPVMAIMRRPVLSCRCEDGAAEVMQTMTRERFRHVVVRKASQEIAGLVSLGDLVAALLEDARLEAGVLRDMARSRLLGLPG